MRLNDKTAFFLDDNISLFAHACARQNITKLKTCCIEECDGIFWEQMG